MCDWVGLWRNMSGGESFQLWALSPSLLTCRWFMMLWCNWFGFVDNPSTVFMPALAPTTRQRGRRCRRPIHLPFLTRPLLLSLRPPCLGYCRDQIPNKSHPSFYWLSPWCWSIPMASNRTPLFVFCILFSSSKIVSFCTFPPPVIWNSTMPKFLRRSSSNPSGRERRVGVLIFSYNLVSSILGNCCTLLKFVV